MQIVNAVIRITVDKPFRRAFIAPPDIAARMLQMPRIEPGSHLEATKAVTPPKNSMGAQLRWQIPAGSDS